MSSHGQADEPQGTEQPAPGYGRRHFGPEDRVLIIAGVPDGPLHADEAGIFRKRARLVAVRMLEAFEVETDQGIVRGEVGDWLATNHPADDPGSDVWVVSAERMTATYEPDAPAEESSDAG